MGDIVELNNKEILEAAIQLGNDLSGRDDFDENFKAITEWADRIDLEPTIGHIYAVNCMAALRMILGAELYNKPVDFNASIEDIEADMDKAEAEVYAYMGVPNAEDPDAKELTE